MITLIENRKIELLPVAGAAAGEAMELEGFSTVEGAAALAPTHVPAAEALDEAAEFDAETGDAPETPVAAAAAGVRPPRPSNWGSMTRVQRRKWDQQGGRPR